MTNYNQKKLSDGRLTDTRVKAVNRGSHSNYLVSNDGVQTMDLPRNFSAPRGPESSNRRTPILIPPIKYIVYNNPQVAYDFLISKGLNVEPTIPSTLQFAMIFIKQEGDPGILEFVAAVHPDKDVILKAVGQKESSFAETTQSDSNSTTETKKEEKTESKTENKLEGWFKLNSQTIIIILVIIVFFLIIRPNK
jgi:hypothetical protein